MILYQILLQDEGECPEETGRAVQMVAIPWAIDAAGRVERQGSEDCIFARRVIPKTVLQATHRSKLSDAVAEEVNIVAADFGIALVQKAKIIP